MLSGNTDRKFIRYGSAVVELLLIAQLTYSGFSFSLFALLLYSKRFWRFLLFVIFAVFFVCRRSVVPFLKDKIYSLFVVWVFQISCSSVVEIKL